MSAVRFWRTVYSTNRAPGVAPFVTQPRDVAIAESDVWEVAPAWVTPQFLAPEHGILHTLVFDANDRRRSAASQSHLQTHPLPAGALFDFQNGVFVASPALTFVQMAQLLDLPQLIAFGCELCGLYSFDERAPRGFRMRETPLVTLAQLASFAESMAGARGHQKAMRAIGHIVERAASPMETTSALLLSLPCRRGGYALPKPQLNCRIDLSDAARRIYRAQFCKADMLFCRTTIVEYQGKFDHSAPDSMQSDRRRTNALEEMGFQVIELTASQTYDLLALEAIALRIARAAGKRIAPEKRGATASRVSLRNALFTWNEAGGRQE